MSQGEKNSDEQARLQLRELGFIQTTKLILTLSRIGQEDGYVLEQIDNKELFSAIYEELSKACRLTAFSLEGDLVRKGVPLDERPNEIKEALIFGFSDYYFNAYEENAWIGKSLASFFQMTTPQLRGLRHFLMNSRAALLASFPKPEGSGSDESAHQRGLELLRLAQEYCKNRTGLPPAGESDPEVMNKVIAALVRVSGVG